MDGNTPKYTWNYPSHAYEIFFLGQEHAYESDNQKTLHAIVTTYFTTSLDDKILFGFKSVHY